MSSSNLIHKNIESQDDRSDRGVLCAKCEHINTRGVSECRKCGSHLFITCVDCGHRNERVRERCKSCGRRLHRGVIEKLRRRFFGGHTNITPAQVMVILFSIALVFGLIVFIANISLPTLW